MIICNLSENLRSKFCYRTNIGRARAWIRLALMQKRLADYMRTLVEKMRDVLADYYGIILNKMAGNLKS